MKPARYARGSSLRYEIYSADRKESLIAALYGLENILYSNRVWIYFQRFLIFLNQSMKINMKGQEVYNNGRTKKEESMGLSD